MQQIKSDFCRRNPLSVNAALHLQKIKKPHPEYDYSGLFICPSSYENKNP